MNIPAPIQRQALILVTLFLMATPVRAEYQYHRLSVGCSATALFAKKDLWVERTLQKMTLPQKVGQMIVASIEKLDNGDSGKEYHLLSRLCREGKIGGIMFLKGDLTRAGELSNHFQSLSTIPLLISADTERGLAMRLSGATEFPPAMALAATGNPEFGYAMSKVIAREARSSGIRQSYFPTLDLNINPANPIISTRSFGDNIPITVAMSAAIIDGLQSNGIIATAKHFPGHGDVSIDSHLALPVLEADRQRLEEYELKPFRAAIRQGIMSIMIGHLAVPKVTGNLEPASISRPIVTGILREELGFNGLIITDALNMKALNNGSNAQEISVKAVLAGNDILLFPPDPELAHSAVLSAVKNGVIPLSQINASVRRILLAKRWLGLDQSKTVNLSRIPEAARRPEDLRLAESIAECAVTLVRDWNGFLPFPQKAQGKMLSIIVQDRPGEDVGSAFTEKLGKEMNAEQLRLDPSSNNMAIQDAASKAAQASAVIVSLHVRAFSASNPLKLSEQQKSFLHTLPATLPPGTPLILVSFGTPYILNVFPEAGTALCTYSSSDTAASTVVGVLKGNLTPAGHLPVSLNGIQP